MTGHFEARKNWNRQATQHTENTVNCHCLNGASGCEALVEQRNAGAVTPEQGQPSQKSSQA